MGILSSTMNIALIILGFGLLIFVHELGHFLAAKWANIRTEGFAIGMGPVVLAWRKGIGLRFGSTDSEYLRRAQAQIGATGSEQALTREQIYDAADSIGLGETEYSLRILPIGGFVKMLGQEDANPSATSTDVRSYNRCSVGKRMIVVSAGVIMNLLCAAILFMITFSVGVQFEAPKVGDVIPGLPAASARAVNAEQLEDAGIKPVLQPGDRVTWINDRSATTFADIQIASAMSRRDQELTLAVQRQGVEQELRFNITPMLDSLTGLRSIGITPPRSTVIEPRLHQSVIREQLETSGLAEKGIEPGMRMVEADGHAIHSYHQFAHIVAESGGGDIDTVWSRSPKNADATDSRVTINIETLPRLQLMWYAQTDEAGVRDAVRGLLGLVPLQRISAVMPDSPNRDVLQAGDVFLRAGGVAWPRRPELMEAISSQAGQQMAIRVLRDDQPVDLTVTVSRRGVIGVQLTDALELLTIADPMEQVAERTFEAAAAATNEPWSVVSTPFEGGKLLAGSKIVAANGQVVTNWQDLRAELLAATTQAFLENRAESIELKVIAPNPDEDSEIVQIDLTSSDIQSLHALGWQTRLDAMFFSPEMTRRSSDGNPFRALMMGVEETWKVVLLTYVTIDRLFRGTIGVEQLRGPVGIVHLGFQIMDRGVLYLLFLLAAISVNLAVINFLPLPIVDGGLFLFLVYEKIKGRPPSIAFQNFATIIGLALIATLFLVVTWNDVMRLVM